MSPHEQPSSPANAETAALRERVDQLERQLHDAETRLREMAIADAITGLFSYRYFQGRIAEEVARADRFGLDVSCLMLSIAPPSFEGLLAIAQRLKDSCRMYDVPARWGQNELVMLLPATDLDGALTFAERFRLGVEHDYRDHATLQGLTIALGVATYPLAGIDDAERLLESADAALHFAVQQGGNRTVVPSPTPEQA